MKEFLRRGTILKINLLFIFVFSNIWEFVLTGELFNGMILSFFLFGPSVFLWYVKSVRAAMLVTLISIFEVTLLVVFISQGFALVGLVASVKLISWLPYLIMAGFNAIVGLRVYARHKVGKIKRGEV